MATDFCPYLYPVEDAAGNSAAQQGASSALRMAGRTCHGLRTPAPVDAAHQASYCLSANHTRCSVFLTAQAEEALQAGAPTTLDARTAQSAPQVAGSARGSALRRYLPWMTLGAIFLVVAAIYIPELLGGGVAEPAPAGVALPAAQATNAGVMAASTTPTPRGTMTPAANAARPSPPVASVSPAANSTQDLRLVLQPVSGASGWWASGDTIAEHLQDSFLYAGYYEQRTIISAFTFGLHRVSRGAPILDARIELTGLNADKFEPNARGTWSVQLLDPASAPELNRAGFQALYNAPVAVSLFPSLLAEELGAGERNAVVLDAEGREWLEQQILDGSTTIVARIVGPSGGDETLFGWDSGVGPGTRGNPPQLTLTLGPAPKTPPPLATPRMIVATLTLTPENVFTAAAHAATVMAEAAAQGGTSAPYLIVTPTPPAENLATAQAIAFMLGLPPLAIHTPTPANEATATADALRATAVAMTTGTFTPTPVGAVTPIIIMPTPVPMNAATALAQVLTATVQAQQHGPETPRPPNVLVATATPTPVTPVATPANPATAAVRAAEATLTAMAKPATALPASTGATGTAVPTAAPATATVAPATPTVAQVPAPQVNTPATPTVAPVTPTVAPATPTVALATPTVAQVPPAAATRTPTAGPAGVALAPRLLEPANEASGSSFTFRWEPSGPLPPGTAYEVVCWDEGENPAAARGVAPPTQDTSLQVNLEPLYTSGLFQAPRLHWTVIVVRTEGYTRLTQPGVGEFRSVNR